MTQWDRKSSQRLWAHALWTILSTPFNSWNGDYVSPLPLVYRGFVFCWCSVPAVTCGVWTPGAAFGWLMDAALPRAHDAFMGVNTAADAPLFMARWGAGHSDVCSFCAHDDASADVVELMASLPRPHQRRAPCLRFSLTHV